LQVKDNFRISKSHWYGFLPRRLQYHLVDLAIKLGFIHRYGKLEVVVTHPDGSKSTAHGYNILVNVGLIQLGDILTGAEATNIDIGYIEAGSGTTTPDITDIDTETPLTPADRLAATVQTRATSSPYEIVIEAFINSTKYTRPQDINNLNIFFTPDETGTLFARGVLGSTITLNAGDTATISYGFVWR
jgi:hypothetical protein